MSETAETAAHTRFDPTVRTVTPPHWWPPVCGHCGAAVAWAEVFTDNAGCRWACHRACAAAVGLR